MPAAENRESEKGASIKNGCWGSLLEHHLMAVLVPGGTQHFSRTRSYKAKDQNHRWILIAIAQVANIENKGFLLFTVCLSYPLQD